MSKSDATVIERLYDANAAAEEQHIRARFADIDRMRTLLRDDIRRATVWTTLVVSAFWLIAPWLAVIGSGGWLFVAIVVLLLALLAIVLRYRRSPAADRGAAYYIENWRSQLAHTTPVLESGSYVLWLREFRSSKERSSIESSYGGGLEPGGPFSRPTMDSFETGIDVVLHNVKLASRCITVQRPSQATPSGDFHLVPIFSDDWMSWVGAFISSAPCIIVSFDSLTQALELELKEIVARGRENDTIVLGQSEKLATIGQFHLLAGRNTQRASGPRDPNFADNSFEAEAELERDDGRLGAAVCDFVQARLH